MARSKHRHHQHPRKSAWNAGSVVGAKRALKAQQVWAIRFHLDHEGRKRDRALFDIAIDSKLRGCDLVKLLIGDVSTGSEVRRRATVIQQKTGRPVSFEITEEVRQSIQCWLEQRHGGPDQPLFPSRVGSCDHLSTRQYARLVDSWVEAIGLNRRDYGTHSLRRTKASLIYKRTGNLRAVQILLGHTKIESTVRYLGVDVDDALTCRKPLTFDHTNSLPPASCFAMARRRWPAACPSLPDSKSSEWQLTGCGLPSFERSGNEVPSSRFDPLRTAKRRWSTYADSDLDGHQVKSVPSNAIILPSLLRKHPVKAAADAA